MKNKKFSKVEISDYFKKRLEERFVDINISDLDKILNNTKTYGQKNVDTCPYYEVRKKLRNPNYPNSRYHINPLYNMVIVEVDNIIKNVLYLDGRDGYGRNIEWK